MTEKVANVCSSGVCSSTKNTNSGHNSTFDVVKLPNKTMVASPKKTKDNITPSTISKKRAKYKSKRKKINCKECSYSTSKLFNLQRHINCMHIHPHRAKRKKDTDLSITHKIQYPKVCLDVQAVSKYCLLYTSDAADE